MKIGIRCSNQDFSYAIMDGTKEAPKLVQFENLSFPTGFTRAKALRWFYQELEGINKKFKIDYWAIKGVEPMAMKNKTNSERIENEAIVLLLSANVGMGNVVRKVKATIAKDMGLKGKAKYLQTDIEYEKIENFKNCNEKIKEAIIVAWSCLN